MNIRRQRERERDGVYNLTDHWQASKASETLSEGNRGCLFVYMCGCTYVILYFDPHVFVFASWSTPSHTSTKQNLSV